MDRSVPDIFHRFLKMLPSIARLITETGPRRSSVRVVMAGSFETVVVPEQKVQPRAWLSFKRASVYQQNDGVVVVIDWTPAALRNREFATSIAGELFMTTICLFYVTVV
jgi:hypothetical protein